MVAPASWSMPNFNRHALGVAMLVDLLSQEAPIDFPEGAFVAGLLHDLGKLLIAVCLTPEYQAIEKSIRENGRMPLVCEAEILGTTHAELSGDAAQAWSLPASIEAAVRYHHSPASDTTLAGPQHFTLSYAVATADEYINQLGWEPVGYSAPPGDCEHHFPMQHMGIPDIQRVLDVFHEEFESASAFL